jgi:hypothetical protein
MEEARKKWITKVAVNRTRLSCHNFWAARRAHPF